jgi:LysM repeat protein
MDTTKYFKLKDGTVYSLQGGRATQIKEAPPTASIIRVNDNIPPELQDGINNAQQQNQGNQTSTSPTGSNVPNYDPTDLGSMQSAYTSLQQTAKTPQDFDTLRSLYTSIQAENNRQAIQKLHLNALSTIPGGSAAANSFYNALPTKDQLNLRQYMGMSVPGQSNISGPVDSSGLSNLASPNMPNQMTPMPALNMKMPTTATPTAPTTPAAPTQPTVTQPITPTVTGGTGGPGYGMGGPGDQLQYYKMADGTVYALDKTSNSYQKVDSVPQGGAVINWNSTSLPPDLQNAFQSYSSSSSGAGSTPTGSNYLDSSGLPYGATTRDQNAESMARTEMGTTDAPGPLQLESATGIISSDYLSSIMSDPAAVAFYVNAIAYGGYQIGDVVNDLKRGELAKNGDKQADSTTLINPTQTRSQYLNSTQGTNAYGYASHLIPSGSLVGQLDPNITKYGIDMPDEIFKQLVPVLDVNSQAYKDAVAAVPGQFYDLTSEMMNATTDQAKAIADSNYDTWKKNVEQQYGIVLSNNATQAWQQIQGLDTTYGQRGIQGSGLEEQDRDVYMRNAQTMSANTRTALATTELGAQLQQLTSNGSPEDIAAFLAQHPEYSNQFKPSDPSLFDVATLTQQIMKGDPTLSQADAQKQAQAYHDTMLDANGNYLSTTNKTNGTNQYQLVYGPLSPSTAQLPTAQQTVTKNALASEQTAMSNYDNSNPFSVATTQAQALQKKDAGTPATPPAYNPATDINNQPNTSQPNNGQPTQTQTPDYSAMQKQLSDASAAAQKISASISAMNSNKTGTPTPTSPTNQSTTPNYSPGSTTSTLPTGNYTPTPQVTASNFKPNTPTQTPASSNYTIVSGDTLSGIAARNNTTVANLAKLNNIADPNKIQAGASIKLS